MNLTTSHPPSVARAAFAGIALFPLIVTVLHFVQAGHFHPLTQAVSELALGRAGWLMAIAFCSLGTGTLLLAIALRELDPQPRVAPWLIGLSGLLSYGSAFVHADGPGPTTTHGQIHQGLGIATFILMISGMVSVIRPFRRNPQWRPAANPTLIWALAALATFFLIPLSSSDYFGLAQRIFLSVILSWALTISLRASRLSAAETAQTEPIATYGLEPDRSAPAH
jgi:small-conductance mechanosensitive channel